MQGEQQNHGSLCAAEVLTRTSSCTTDSTSSCSGGCSSSSSNSSNSNSSSPSYRVSPIKPSRGDSGLTDTDRISPSSSCSSLSSRSSTTSSRAGFRRFLWKRAHSLGSLLIPPRTPSNEEHHMPPVATMVSGDMVQSAQVVTAASQNHIAPKHSAGQVYDVFQHVQQPVHTACQQQQQQLGPGFQAILDAISHRQGTPTSQSDASPICQQQQQQQPFNPYSLSLGGAIQVQQVQLQQLCTAEQLQLTALQQQQQTFVQTCPQVQLSAAQQQQQQQQQQLAPAMLAPQPYYPTPAAAGGLLQQPHSVQYTSLDTSSTRQCCKATHRQHQVQAVYGNSSSSSLWGTTWAAASIAVQQNSSLQPPRPLHHPGCHPNLRGISSSTGAGHTPGRVVQHCSLPLHWLAALLLYVLLCMVATVVVIHKKSQAVLVITLGARDACTSYLQQQGQLFKRALTEAAAAADAEQLRRLLLSSPKHSSSSSASAAGQAVAAATADFDSTASIMRPSEVHCHNAVDTNSISGFTTLVVAVGLWTGVLLWTGKWLLLQAPAATGSAIAHACQQAITAIQEAGLLTLEYMLRVCYDLAWVVSKRAHAVAVQAVQVGYVQGAAAAQHACCIVLWTIALANCPTDHQQQEQQQQQQQQQHFAVRQLLVPVLQAVGTAAAKCGQAGVTSVESVVTAVALKLLRDASPVTQTAVWGLAGMLRRNVVESCSLCWQLLLQLSQVYMIQLQQHQQREALSRQDTAGAPAKRPRHLTGQGRVVPW